MDAPRDAANLAFAPHFDVRVLDERRILLLSEDRTFLLTGKLYVAIAPYLDGTRTREQILEALRPSAPVDRVEVALSNLLSKKYATVVPRDLPPPRAAFWTELGADPAAAERAVRDTHVAVRPLGRQPGADGAAAAALATALGEAGFALVSDGTADLTVVLVDDYLEPALRAINREMRAGGRRWLPLKLAGRVTWLGPIFRPDGPCWKCLAKRIGENRPGETWTAGGEPVARFPRARFPSARGVAVHLAALELARIVAGLGDAVLAGDTLVTFDFRSPAFTRHVVHRQTVCTECGAAAPPMAAEGQPPGLESRAKYPMADGGSRACAPEEVLIRLTPHVSPLTGIVAGLVDRAPAEGLPVYATRQILPVAIGPRQNRRIGRPDGAAGKGTTDVQARVSCLAEAIERYSTGWQGTEARRRATLAELGDAAVHPARLMNYSDRQYAERERWNASNTGFNWVGAPFEQARAIDWSPAWSLTHERVRWLPTPFCYYNYRGDPDHEFSRAESNGCAAGSVLEEAILQGFMELVERDSCALWWYNRVRRPRVELESFDDPFFRRVEAFLRAKGRSLDALDLTSDLGLPVVLALSHDAGGGKILCGLGAHLNARVAASRAVAELNQMLVLELSPGDGARAATEDDRTFEQWMREATIENQPYVVAAPGRALTAADYPQLETDDLLGDIKACLAAVQRAGLEMLVLDTTRPEVGFPTVRVTVPGLRHFWARFGPGRLYDVPVALGWLDRPRAETELNPIPFFL